MSIFKIGDDVRVVNSSSGNHGRTGKVTGVLLETPDAPTHQQRAFNLFRCFAVEFDGGQIEIFIAQELEARYVS